MSLPTTERSHKLVSGSRQQYGTQSQFSTTSEVPSKSVKKGGKHFPPTMDPNNRNLAKARSVDEFHSNSKPLYAKHTSSGSGNGSVGGSKGGAGSRIKQNSKSSLLASTSSLASKPTPHNGIHRQSSVVDPEKLLAAKKRRQDSIDKKKETSANKSSRGRHKRTWKQRLKVCSTISVSLLLILSSSSLPFTCLIVVDPIVVGLRAQFNKEPGLCR